MAPSPIAFDNFERVRPGESCTPRLPSPQVAANQRKHLQKSSPANVDDVASRLQDQIEKDKATVSASSPLEKRERATGNQLHTKVHPSAVEVMSDRGLRPPSSLVLFDASRVGNRDFRELPRRDMEHIWGKVLDGCRSNVLRQLLSSHGTLMALSVARGTIPSSLTFYHIRLLNPTQETLAIFSTNVLVMLRRRNFCGCACGVRERRAQGSCRASAEQHMPRVSDGAGLPRRAEAEP